MGVQKFCNLTNRLVLASVVSIFGISAVHAAIPATEVVNLPTDAAYGGGDNVGSELIAATYNAGEGPGIWIVADGGYRLYHNGKLLAQDDQAGRVRFIPMTFLPGENAISVVGVNGAGAPGVMVQIDDLDKSYYSGSGWKSKPTVGNASWKNKGRDLSQWGGATTLSYASDKLPSGGALNGFDANTQAKWIWTSDESDPTAVLLYTFYVKAEGFGASTTGGDAGKIVVASDSASIRKYLQSNDAVTILVPEGTYDFRQFRNAVTVAKSKNRTWCKKTCDEKNRVTGKTNTFYRIAFEANSCQSLNDNVSIVQESENLQQWENWITTKANKSLVGMGRGANLRGAAIAVRSNEGSGNHIYRNLGIYDVNPHLIEGGDGLETVGTSSKHVDKFWADHISYKWISDGMDMEFLDNATISYLDFDGANEYNCWGTDPYMALVEDAHLTYANNYWHNTYGRVPKVTGENNGSQVHLYNQYVDYNRFFVAGANGHSASAKAYVRYENSYIDNGQGYLAEWGDYGYVYFSGVSFGNGTKQQHRYNGTVKSGIPTAETFNPSYSFEKRTVANLPKDIPSLSGVGGRYGKMPEYNQGFGQSNKAASVSVTSPAAGAKFKAGESVTLKANAKDNDGTVKSVAFYVGNTLVGTATASPYQVTAKDLEAGMHSAVAVVTDNSGLTWMSESVMFAVEGTAVSSSSEAVSSSSAAVGSSSSSSVDGSVESSSSSIQGDAESSSSVQGEVEGSSSSTTGLAPRSMRIATEAEAGFYRIFDLQGRPLFAGLRKPAKMPAARVIVVEYTTAGSVKRRYIQ